MIGGVDISIPTKTGALSLEASVRVVRQLWIDAVYENGVTGERYLRFEDIPIGKLDEVFIYRDPCAADVWEEKGAVSEAFNSMVHLISDDDSLTLVVDEMNLEMVQLSDAIRSQLADVILYDPAFKEAA
jgi:hypothetical protein